MFAVFLPWVGVDGETTAGLQLRDGLIVLAAGAVAYVMALRRVRAAWIPAAFGAAVAARDLVAVLGEEAVDPAFGLWLATASLGLAAVLLFREMTRGVRRNVRDSRGLPPER